MSRVLGAGGGGLRTGEGDRQGHRELLSADCHEGQCRDPAGREHKREGVQCERCPSHGKRCRGSSLS